MTTQVLSSKREFRVAGEYRYNRSGALRWVLSHLLRYKTFIVSFLLASAGTAVLFSAVPALTGLAFNEVLQPDPDARRLLLIALSILGVVLLRGATDLVNAFSIEVLGQRLERDARDELYVSLLGKSQTFHNRQRIGDIMARATNDVRQLNPMMNPGIALITDSIMGILAPLVFIANIRLQLLISPVIFLICFVFLLHRYTKQLNPIANQMRRQFGEMNAGLTESISGIEVIKAWVSACITVMPLSEAIKARRPAVSIATPCACAPASTSVIKYG